MQFYAIRGKKIVALDMKKRKNHELASSINQPTVRLTEEEQTEFLKAVRAAGFQTPAEFFKKAVTALILHAESGDRILNPVRFESIPAETWRKIAAQVDPNFPPADPNHKQE